MNPCRTFHPFEDGSGQARLPLSFTSASAHWNHLVLSSVFIRRTASGFFSPLADLSVAHFNILENWSVYEENTKIWAVKTIRVEQLWRFGTGRSLKTTLLYSFGRWAIWANHLFDCKMEKRCNLFPACIVIIMERGCKFVMGREKSMKKTICLRRITFEPDVRDKEERGMNMRVRAYCFLKCFGHSIH